MENHYLFSTPGQIEIAGNHTEHQHGKVITAAVDSELIADVVLTGKNIIIVQFDALPIIKINLRDLYVHKDEQGTVSSIIRGIAAAFVRRGINIQGFEAIIYSNRIDYTQPDFCATVEVLFATICNELFAKNKLNFIETARICQFAESEYYGHCCGISRQLACLQGGVMYADFKKQVNPETEQINFDFSSLGYSICLIESGAYCANISGECNDITSELAKLCSQFGKEYLRQIPEKEFIDALPVIRKKVSDRTILRALHIYRENERVDLQLNALKNNNFEDFLKLCTISGQSSWMYMQNIYQSDSIARQGIAFTLALCDMLLNGRGAYRVHGNGFAGTIQAFVPVEMLEQFKKGVERNLGKESCRVLHIRSQGSIRVN